MTAPFPSEDSTESPKLLVAITFAFTFVPQFKLKGGVISTLTGIVHEVCVDSDASQFTRSWIHESSYF